MAYTYQMLQEASDQFGDAFYVLDVAQFQRNYRELEEAFSAIYPHFGIAYSYKTNYIPQLCQAVNALGGFAEVVSGMELDIARRVGVPASRVIFNGPYKQAEAVEALLLAGGTVNIDSMHELENIRRVARAHPDSMLNVGVRVNFSINDGVLSRFGIDAESDALRDALQAIVSIPNIQFVGLHCHFAARGLETWRPRAKGVLALVEKRQLRPAHIDIGGGIFGKMEDALKCQFDGYIPTYSEYAKEAATEFADYYKNTPAEQRPLLLIEPGSALVGDCMHLVSKVQSIKTVRGKPIATLLASMYNINMGKKNPPLQVYQRPGAVGAHYENLDMAGYTCIESDYLYHGYTGELNVGDYVVFRNVGSYSIVFKPPFILPNFPVVAFSKEDGCLQLVKRAETVEDIFGSYVF